MECPFCQKNNIYSFFDKTNNYWRCKSCGGIFLDQKSFLSLVEQKKRYDYHNNDCMDVGYRLFLERFIEPVLLYINTSLLRILDYGCGPCNKKGISNLNSVIKEYGKTKQNIITLKTELVQWDPFFAKDATVLKSPADLVCCLEVVEHFENPNVGFIGLSRSCKVGGLVAIGTMLVPNTDEEFIKWWYKNDSTHVSFYSLESLKQSGSRVGLKYITSLSNRCFIFQKE